MPLAAFTCVNVFTIIILLHVHDLTNKLFDNIVDKAVFVMVYSSLSFNILAFLIASES